MSRSNPTQNIQHPCERWFQWNGEHGTIGYYDKEAANDKGGKGANISVPLPVAFIVLDRMATVKGWHDASESGIHANEVRDTTREPMVVKAHKGGVLAQGFYKDIKDRVASVGGHYVANIYVAYKDTDQQLHIGSIQFKGASLGSWMEFEKAHRKAIWEKAVRITGSVEGKKGKVVFKTPVFTLAEVTPETNAAAIALDKELQEYLDAYLKRNVREQVPAAAESPEPEPEPEYTPEPPLEMDEPPAPDPDDVPF
jgi:hypothetical protein